METSLYETDFYGWTMQQSKLLAKCPYSLEQLLDLSFPDDIDVEF